MKKKFLASVLLLTFFCAPNYLWASEIEEATRRVQSLMNILDSEVAFLRSVTVIGRQHFLSANFVASAEPGYSDISLDKVVFNYQNGAISTPLTLEKARSFVRDFSEMTGLHNRLAIITDPKSANRFLYRRTMEYGAGFLIASTRLTVITPSAAFELELLRDRVVKSLRPYLEMGGEGPSSISDWEDFYFRLIFAQSSEFSADIVSGLAFTLERIAFDEKRALPERKTAARFVVQLAEICMAQCSKPVLTEMNTSSTTIENVKLNLFRIGDRVLVERSLMVGGGNFYYLYAPLLRQLKPEKYEEIKSRRIKNEWRGFFNTVKQHLLNLLRASPDGIRWQYLKATLDEFFKFIRISLLILLFVLPTWLLALIFSVIISFFWGSGKYRYQKFSYNCRSVRWTSVVPEFLRANLAWLSANLKSAIRAPFTAVSSGWAGGGNNFDKVVYAVFLLSLSWWLADLKQQFDYYGFY